MQTIKVISYGLGVSGRTSAKLMLESGVDIVAAIDANPDVVGKDLGDVLELGRNLGVVVSDDAEAVLAEHSADVVLMAVRSGMEKMFPHYERCLRHGFNLLNTAEDFVFPWHQNPDQAQQLDQLAKEKGVSLASSGMQDVYMMNLGASAAAACHRIDDFDLYMESNLGHSDPHIMPAIGIGASESDFMKIWDEQPPIALDITSAMCDAIAADMGAERLTSSARVEPILAESPIEMAELGLSIATGTVKGFKIIGQLGNHQLSYPQQHWLDFL